MKKFFLLNAMAVAAICLSTRAMATDFHDPETEPDYGPGFWESDIGTTVENTEGDEVSVNLLPGSANEFMPIEILISFPQTKWNECRAQVTGNYSDAVCAEERNISEILNKFLQEELINCVDAGLAAQGGGTAEAIHVTHEGITADIRHSPHSLHSFNRAIDVKVVRVQLTNGEDKQFTYSKVGNRPFYTGLRTCWGKMIHSQNGCPYYRGDEARTGSIGWENTAHGHHMHLSVPYCLNGAYGPHLWQR